MPHVGIDGAGGVGGGLARSESTRASAAATLQPDHQRQQQQQKTAYGTGWLAMGAARPVTSSSGNNYVVLGGTRYGLRLSQDSIVQAAKVAKSDQQPLHQPSMEEPAHNQLYRKLQYRRNSHESEPRERLSDGKPADNYGKPLILDLAATDCCMSCIGPRSSPSRGSLTTLNSRIPLSWSSGNNSSNSNSTCSASGAQATKQPQQQQPAVSRQHHHHHHYHTVVAPNSNNSVRCWPNSSSSSCYSGGGGGCIEQAAVSSGSQGSLHGATTNSSVSVVPTTCANHNAANSPLNSSCSSSSSCSPLQPTIISASLQQQQQHHTLPRLQIAQWTKHHSLRLQEPAAVAVDRIQRFRWSGGNNGSGANAKKSNNSGTKAVKLRELTEKLKGSAPASAPVPPPRRPSRCYVSSPDSSSSSFSISSQQSQQSPAPNEGRFSSRSHTFSESSPNSVPTLAQGSRPSSATTPSTTTTTTTTTTTPSSHPRQLCRSASIDEERDYFVLDPQTNVLAKSPRHSRQYSDSAAGSSFEDACTDHAKSVSCDGEPQPTRSSTSSWLGNVPTGGKFRSASFGQADTNCELDRQVAAQSVDYRRAVYAAMGGNGAGACNATNSGAGSGHNKASTLPRSARRSPSPRRATSPSFVDSAVGSSAEVASSSIDESLLFRPRSDASDSMTASSSAVVGPELVDRQQQQQVQRQPRDSTETPETKANGDARKDCPHEVIITPPQEDATSLSGAKHDSNNLVQQPQQQQQQPQLFIRRLSQASEASEAPSESAASSGAAASQEATTVTAAAAQAASGPTGKLPRRYRGDTSKRRKGVYITQWPSNAASAANAASTNESYELKNKLSTQSSDERDELPPSATPSDLSDCEGQTPRRYSKRPLRGPYGQMLEAEMAKPRATDLVSLDASSGVMRQRRKVSTNLSFNASSSAGFGVDQPPVPCHHRTTSSPSKLEGLPGPSPELLAELLKGSSERVARAPPMPVFHNASDTRTHVVVELYETERSYVEALQTLVHKYLQPLKSPEYANLVDSNTVDEIFYQVPAILSHHEVFLEELRKRLETWELRQTIGDIFLEVFTKPEVLETYTLFLDNWKTAKKAIKAASQAKSGFQRFLETMEREHKGKLGLDQLLIKPVQKIPRYELLIQRLLKHTEPQHPDHDLLTAAFKEVHELVVKINCTERESLEWEQQQSTLRDVQALVEGLAGIVTNDRSFIRHDLVSIASNQGTRKERGLFLFSDFLVITSIKRRSGTIRKPSTSSCPNSIVGLLEANKYKMLMRISLDDLEVMKAKDENLRRMAQEVDHLRDDCATLNQLQELATTLHGTKAQLEELIKDMQTQTQKLLAERNAAHSQLACLELTLNTQNGMENISVVFARPDKRASWEESFNEAKQKLAASTDRRPVPEFVGPVPIRKTRAGLQFTCAAPTLANPQGVRDVWVCNSDGLVGQVCVLSLNPEPPQVTSCNGVCSARILCVAGIPACTSVSQRKAPTNRGLLNKKIRRGGGKSIRKTNSGNIQIDSSSSDDSDSEDIPSTDNPSASRDASNSSSAANDEEFNQPTMWLGTEDGCIHVYNCSDNIRIKKNKIKLQHGSSVYCIIYLDNKVFVSLANGNIIVYSRDQQGGWNTTDSVSLTVGSVAAPVTKMLPVSGKLWCATHVSIKILNTYSLEIEHAFNVSNDPSRTVSCMSSSGSLGVWIALHNSASLKLYHATSHECLADVNIAPAVTSMLVNCDDIIRQHKAACLRVTSLLACNDLLWIGTSAGVVLTLPIPLIKDNTQRMSQAPVVTGIPHGHTGIVRFLTCVEMPSPPKSEPRPKANRYSLKGSKSLTSQHSNASATNSNGSTTERGKLLVISGGDGYEDFRGPQASAELQAGREDSTNHLLLWKVFKNFRNLVGNTFDSQR
ncbi:hypothetical protein TKK_0011150 [Trichogramma kaykai]